MRVMKSNQLSKTRKGNCGIQKKTWEAKLLNLIVCGVNNGLLGYKVRETSNHVQKPQICWLNRTKLSMGFTFNHQIWLEWVNKTSFKSFQKTEDLIEALEKECSDQTDWKID